MQRPPGTKILGDDVSAKASWATKYRLGRPGQKCPCDDDMGKDVLVDVSGLSSVKPLPSNVFWKIKSLNNDRNIILLHSLLEKSMHVRRLSRGGTEFDEGVNFTT